MRGFGRVIMFAASDGRRDLRTLANRRRMVWEELLFAGVERIEEEEVVV